MLITWPLWVTSSWNLSNAMSSICCMNMSTWTWTCVRWDLTFFWCDLSPYSGHFGRVVASARESTDPVLLVPFLETKLKEAAGQKFYHPTIPVLFVQAEEWKIIETNDNALHFCWPVLLLLPREEDNQTLGSTTYFSDKSLHSCYTQLKSRGEMARFFFANEATGDDSAKLINVCRPWRRSYSLTWPSLSGVISS